MSRCCAIPARRRFLRAGLLSGGVFALWAVVGAGQSAGAAGLVTEVIPIGYRSAAELLPVLEPLVPPPGVITGMGNQLVVKTTAANLRELRAVLARLDRPPANLLLSVRHELDESIRQDLARAAIRVESGQASATVGTGGLSAGVRDGHRAPQATASARVRSSTLTGSTRDTQRLRVLEGRQAFIHAGVSVPVTRTETVVRGDRVTVIRSDQLEDVGTGFYVRPRLDGERVLVEISAYRDRAEGGVIRTSEANTTVSGELGRWMVIASDHTERGAARTGIASRSSRSRNAAHAVYIKVEVIR